MNSLSDVTLGDVAKGLTRYRPFILLVAAIALVVVVLPGKPRTEVTSSANVATKAATGGATQTPAAGGTTQDTGSAVPGAVASGPTFSGTRATTTRTAGGSVSPALAAAGSNVQYDANCDTTRMRIKIPSLAAPPCVPVFTGNNGGSTYQGVTKDTITIVHYYPKADPAVEAALTAAGANNSEEDNNATYDGWADFWQHHVNLYGRKVKLVHYHGNAASTDDAAGKADAVDIAKNIKPFMVWGSINDGFVNEIVANKIVCVCTTTLGRDYYGSRAPYVWGNGLPDQHQAYTLRAEMIGKQIAFDKGVPAKAKHAGDVALQTKDRSFGLIWYNTGQDSYRPGVNFFKQELAKYGVTLRDDASYILDANTAQQTSDTIITRFKEEGITSIIFAGDFVYPIFFTGAASNQNYHPEWIITGSALTDTTLFARVYDKNQWNHAFGLSLLSGRVARPETDAWSLYQWRFHRDPPANNQNGVIYVPPFVAFTGMQMAGPNLTPQTFRSGLFSVPVSPAQPGITVPTVSWGRQLWGWDDYNVSDDATEIWWDNTAQGPDELEKQGVGMYRFVDGGKRYLPGQIPSTPFKAFDPTGTVTVYDKRPPADRPPDYGPEKSFY